MRPEDLAEFAKRDRATIAASKEEHWLEERQRRGVRWCFAIADDLRRQVTRQRPGWPTSSDRQADLDTHVRVGAALRRVDRARRH